MDQKSYDELLKECLSDAEKVMDTREGSLAYIISAAFALRLAELYSKMQSIEDNAFVVSATGEHLDLAVQMIGMERKSPTKPIVKIEGGSGFMVGDKFASENYEYTVINVYDDYYLAECSVGGTEANNYLGEVVALADKAQGATMNVTKIVAAGEDAEDDEALRERFIERIRCPICAGNLAYYKEAINSLTGVGGAKIIPVADGVGTVRVVITDNEYGEAAEELVSYVKETLDPEETSGQGHGIVPIGHKVTVESAQKVDVDIVVEFEPSVSSAYFERYGRSGIPSVFKEINKTWAKNDGIILRDRVFEDFFLKYGATDVNVISINGEPNRLKLGENQILGGITINGT